MAPIPRFIAARPTETTPALAVGLTIPGIVRHHPDRCTTMDEFMRLGYGARLAARNAIDRRAEARTETAHGPGGGPSRNSARLC